MWIESDIVKTLKTLLLIVFGPPRLAPHRSRNFINNGGVFQDIAWSLAKTSWAMLHGHTGDTVGAPHCTDASSIDRTLVSCRLVIDGGKNEVGPLPSQHLIE